MTNFELWVKSCEEFEVQIWSLCSSSYPETGLYKTTQQYTAANRDYYTEPVYHIWINGVSHNTTMNLQEAFRMWEYNKP